MTVTIRAITDQDGRAAGRIFFDAVHLGTTDTYTSEQRIAWAGAEFDPDLWVDRMIGAQGFIAESENQEIGFMTYEPSGYISLAYVDPHFMGQGVARKLYTAIEKVLIKQGATRLTTAASEKAKPFFLKCGWQVEARQTVVRHGVELHNYRMFKNLP